MRIRKAKRKWSKLEWLMLLSPLVLVVGLMAMQFSPQLQHSWREWRDYGSNRPYAVFYPQVKGVNSVIFAPLQFSSDSKYIALVETPSDLSYSGEFLDPHPRSSTPSPSPQVEVWDLTSNQLISSWRTGKESPSTTLHFEAANELRVDNQDWSKSGLMRREIRDILSTRLIREGICPTRPQVPPASLQSAFIEPVFLQPVSDDFKEKPQKAREVRLGNTLLNISVVPIKSNVILSSLFTYRTYYFEQWIATILNPKTHRIVRSFSLISHYDFKDTDNPHRLSSDMQTNMSFCISPDGGTLLTRIEYGALHDDKSGVNQDYCQLLEAFDTLTGRLLWKQDMRTESVCTVAFTPSSHFAAIYNLSTNNFDIRDVRTGAILQSLQPHAGSTLYSEQMQFSPDGKLLAIPQDDRLELWDVSDLH